MKRKKFIYKPASKHHVRLQLKQFSMREKKLNMQKVAIKGEFREALFNYKRIAKGYLNDLLETVNKTVKWGILSLDQRNGT